MKIGEILSGNKGIDASNTPAKITAIGNNLNSQEMSLLLVL